MNFYLTDVRSLSTDFVTHVKELATSLDFTKRAELMEANGCETIRSSHENSTLNCADVKQSCIGLGQSNKRESLSSPLVLQVTIRQTDTSTNNVH